jgi:DegV family protein with EDD domain
LSNSGRGIAYLDGPRLSKGLRAGIGRIIADQERLNRINVFPVPDGDTGTNLTITMQSVLSALAVHDDTHAGRTLERVADAALDGARGNSGAILAQFFHGLGDACGHLRLITTDSFIEAVQRGADYARDALSEPREGTVLTVLTDFAAELHRVRDRGHDFADLLEKGLDRARRALAETTNQLEVLRKAGVVDAGAQGFVDLLQGVTDFVRRGTLEEADLVRTGESQEEAFESIEVEADAHHRFCTECVITGEGIDRRRLREALAGAGSSLVVVGTARKTRVHIHVDEPDVVFRFAGEFGAVSGQKADDMQLQTRTRSVESGSVAVVVDSAGDVAEDDLVRLGIYMVPVRVHFGHRSFLDKVSLTPDQFYAELQDNPEHPKTSQPAPGDFRRLYQFLAAHRRPVVSIHVSARVSGTFQAAQSAAARVGEDARVITVDSRNASLGQGLVAMSAARMAAKGFSLDEITTRLDDVIRRTRTFGLLRDMRYAVRGGRVHRSKKIVADLLRLQPVLTNFPDGTIGAGGFVLGRRNAPEKFAGFVARRLETGKRYRLAVGHACNPDEAERLLGLLLERPGIESHYLTEVGPALGAHGGPGMLVVGLQEVNPDEPG